MNHPLFDIALGSFCLLDIIFVSYVIYKYSLFKKTPTKVPPTVPAPVIKETNDPSK